MITLAWFDVVSISFFVLSTLWVAHRVDDDVKAFDVLETTITGVRGIRSTPTRATRTRTPRA